MRSPQGKAQKPLPVSRFQYHLQVDPDSLPAGVVARERQVPGTEHVQTWIRNVSGIPFVILSVNRQGTVIRRQKIVGGRAYVEAPQGQQAPDEMQAREWQRLEGVEEVLLHLNYTPDAIVVGRSREAGEAAEAPLPEPFSIPATFGGEQRPIKGQIVYSETSAGEMRPPGTRARKR